MDVQAALGTLSFFINATYLNARLMRRSLSDWPASMEQPLPAQGTAFGAGQSQGSEGAGSKRPGTTMTTVDSDCSAAFKRARTDSSALSDLLPLASDASTMDPRYILGFPAHSVSREPRHSNSWVGRSCHTLHLGSCLALPAAVAAVGAAAGLCRPQNDSDKNAACRPLEKLPQKADLPGVASSSAGPATEVQLKICRDGRVQRAAVRLAQDHGLGTRRLVHWCGAQFQVSATALTPLLLTLYTLEAMLSHMPTAGQSHAGPCLKGADAQVRGSTACLTRIAFRNNTML